MGFNPIKGIIKALAILLSNLDCKWKCTCCDCDCNTSAAEMEQILNDAFLLALRNKYPNMSDESLKKNILCL